MPVSDSERKAVFNSAAATYAAGVRAGTINPNAHPQAIASALVKQMTAPGGKFNHLVTEHDPTTGASSPTATANSDATAIMNTIASAIRGAQSGSTLNNNPPGPIAHTAHAPVPGGTATGSAYQYTVIVTATTSDGDTFSTPIYVASDVPLSAATITAEAADVFNNQAFMQTRSPPPPGHVTGSATITGTAIIQAVRQ